ncbi:MAG: hypothetical protein ACFB11_09300 [Paracoccaceae bacterium]
MIRAPSGPRPKSWAVAQHFAPEAPQEFAHLQTATVVENCPGFEDPAVFH